MLTSKEGDILKKIFKLLDKIILNICIVFMGLIALFVISSVILRYFFGIAFVWSQELITFLFIFTTFFGSVIAIQYEEHISIRYFYKLMPDKIQRFMDIIFKIFLVYLQVQIIRVSLQWIDKVGNVLTPGLRFPVRYIYMILPISALLMIVYALRKLFLNFK